MVAEKIGFLFCFLERNLKKQLDDYANRRTFHVIVWRNNRQKFPVVERCSLLYLLYVYYLIIYNPEIYICTCIIFYETIKIKFLIGQNNQNELYNNFRRHFRYRSEGTAFFYFFLSQQLYIFFSYENFGNLSSYVLRFLCYFISFCSFGKEDEPVRLCSKKRDHGRLTTSKFTCAQNASSSNPLHGDVICIRILFFIFHNTHHTYYQQIKITKTLTRNSKIVYTISKLEILVIFISSMGQIYKFSILTSRIGESGRDIYTKGRDLKPHNKGSNLN